VEKEIMGNAEEARSALLAKAREWCELRQPMMATAKELRERDQREHQVRFELANAAALWAWHEEHSANPLNQIREALAEANEVCRSAYQIAARGGAETNWAAFTTRLEGALERQHGLMYPKPLGIGLEDTVLA
jgi:hypothetical protein